MDHLIQVTEAEYKPHKLIQQQLEILRHAQQCLMRGSENPGVTLVCTTPHCKEMKEVLAEMTNCQMYEGEPYCTYSNPSFGFFIVNCQRDDCGVCGPKNQERETAISEQEREQAKELLASYWENHSHLSIPCISSGVWNINQSF